MHSLVSRFRCPCSYKLYLQPSGLVDIHRRRRLRCILGQLCRLHHQAASMGTAIALLHVRSSLRGHRFCSRRLFGRRQDSCAIFACAQTTATTQLRCRKRCTRYSCTSRCGAAEHLVRACSRGCTDLRQSRQEPRHNGSCHEAVQAGAVFAGEDAAHTQK